MLGTSTDMIDKTKFLFRKKTVSNFDLLQSEFTHGEEKIDYIWSKDPFYIRQYAKMVDKYYEEELALEDAFKQLGLYDLRSHFYIVKINERVISGVRITVNNPFETKSLPTERFNLDYAGLFPELDLLHNRCAEVSKFTILPEHRNNIDHYVNAFKSFKELFDEQQVKYFFICASRARLRIYNRIAKKHFKVLDTRPFDVSNWQDYEDLEFYVCAYENPDVK